MMFVLLIMSISLLIIIKGTKTHVNEEHGQDGSQLLRSRGMVETIEKPSLQQSIHARLLTDDEQFPHYYFSAPETLHGPEFKIELVQKPEPKHKHGPKDKPEPKYKIDPKHKHEPKWKPEPKPEHKPKPQPDPKQPQPQPKPHPTPKSPVNPSPATDQPANWPTSQPTVMFLLPTEPQQVLTVSPVITPSWVAVPISVPAAQVTEQPTVQEVAVPVAAVSESPTTGCPVCEAAAESQLRRGLSVVLTDSSAGSSVSKGVFETGVVDTN